MKLNRRAKKLAAILYDTAGGEAVQVHTSLQHISNLIKKDAQLKSLFQSKRIPNDKSNSKKVTMVQTNSPGSSWTKGLSMITSLIIVISSIQSTGQILHPKLLHLRAEIRASSLRL